MIIFCMTIFILKKNRTYRESQCLSAEPQNFIIMQLSNILPLSKKLQLLWIRHCTALIIFR